MVPLLLLINETRKKKKEKSHPPKKITKRGKMKNNFYKKIHRFFLKVSIIYSMLKKSVSNPEFSLTHPQDIKKMRKKIFRSKNYFIQKCIE